MVLIVTEGEKTEPKYFNGLSTKLRLAATRVEIVKSVGTDAASVVKFAIAKREDRLKEVKRGDGVSYEDVWVVFDTEQNFGTEQLVRATELAKGHGIRVAMSAPCFEYWLILHFEYTTASMVSYAQAAKRLKKHLPEYDKSDPPIAELLLRLPTAVQNAQRCRVAQEEVGAMIPRTDIDLLVIKLNDAARQQNRIMR